MDVRYSEELSQAFVVGPSGLKKLVELLQKRIGKVDISADCEDEIERKFNTVKDFIAYENSKLKRIRRIHLSARSNDYSKSATIIFRDALWANSRVSINVNGREDVVSRFKEEVLDIAAGMRPWYNWIASADLFTMFGIGFCAFLFILAIFILFEWIPISDSPPSDSKSIKSSALMLLFISGTLLGLWGLHRLRGFLFPKGVFAIGQGESRHKHMEQVRWGVVIAFLVSFAAGLLLLLL